MVFKVCFKFSFMLRCGRRSWHSSAFIAHCFLSCHVVCIVAYLVTEYPFTISSPIRKHIKYNFFISTSNVSVMNVSCPLGIQTECSKCLPAAATQNRSLFGNDRIALSMNSCRKSFHIDSKSVFSSEMLVGPSILFNEVIFEPESQFNY